MQSLVYGNTDSYERFHPHFSDERIFKPQSGWLDERSDLNVGDLDGFRQGERVNDN